MTPFMSPALEDEARAKARRSTTPDHTHACSGANAMRQLDCEEKRDPDLAKSRIKDENMELDPKARLEKQTLARSLNYELTNDAKRALNSLGYSQNIMCPPRVSTRLSGSWLFR